MTVSLGRTGRDLCNPSINTAMHTPVTSDIVAEVFQCSKESGFSLYGRQNSFLVISLLQSLPDDKCLGGVLFSKLLCHKLWKKPHPA